MRLYQSFMLNAALRPAIFTPTEANDHEHCVLCGARFSKKPGDLRNGYVTLDNPHWLCPACLTNFCTEYHLTVLSASDAST